MRERRVNSLTTEMDGLESNLEEGVVLSIDSLVSFTTEEVILNNRDTQRRRRRRAVSETSFLDEQLTVLSESLINIETSVTEQVGEIWRRMNHSTIVNPFKLTSLLLCLMSALLSLSDMASDALVSLKLYNAPESEWWFRLTLFLAVAPLLVTNGVSLAWLLFDVNDDRREALRDRRLLVLGVLLHLLLLGPVARQLYVLYCGVHERRQIQKGEHKFVKVQGPYCVNEREVVKSERKNYYGLRTYYERDSGYLAMMKAFLQDSPQIVLQSYIALQRHDQHITADTLLAVLQALSVTVSLISLSWSVVSYEQASRHADSARPNISPLGLSVQFLWRFFLTTSRVITLALFANRFHFEIFALVVGHWAIMTAWIVAMRTSFCSNDRGDARPLHEFVYNVIIGWVFVIDIIHVKNGPTRFKLSLFYAIMAIEMAAMLSLWYYATTNFPVEDMDALWTDQAIFFIVSFTPICFVLGIIFMISYYVVAHPDGRMPNKDQRASLF